LIAIALENDKEPTKTLPPDRVAGTARFQMVLQSQNNGETDIAIFFGGISWQYR
jgi:hypothetical protein